MAAPAGWAMKNANLDSALVDSLYRGDGRAAISALEHGANPNARSAEGIPALTLAVLHADRPTVNKLIGQGASVNARSGLGRTALIAAASIPGGSGIIRILLSARSRSSRVEVKRHGSRRRKISRRGLPDCCCRGAADPNAQDKMGNSALHLAATYGNAQVVRLLLDHHAGVNGSNKLGGTPLINAAMRNDAGIVRMLVGAGAGVDAADGSGSTALMGAAYSEKGDSAAVDMLLRAGANAQATNKLFAGETAMTWALGNGETQIVKRLREAGPRSGTGTHGDFSRHQLVTKKRP